MLGPPSAKQGLVARPQLLVLAQPRSSGAWTCLGRRIRSEEAPSDDARGVDYASVRPVRGSPRVHVDPHTHRSELVRQSLHDLVAWLCRNVPLDIQWLRQCLVAVEMDV